MVLSAQDFVRALKSPNDPPHPGGPAKIELAQAAWEDESLYIPNKGEVIADWLLTKLLKDKDKEYHCNPLFDIRYSTLLNAIVGLSHDTQQRSKDSKSKPWLSRVPIAPIVLSFISLITKERHEVEVVAATSNYLGSLWSHAAPKLTAETLLECFGSLLDCIFALWNRSAFEPPLPSSLIELFRMIMHSARRSFSNSNNRKKLSSSFVDVNFSLWLDCMGIHVAHENPEHTLVKEIYDTGIEVLFNVETMRLINEPNNTWLRDALARQCSESRRKDLVTACLPLLFTSFIHATRKYRGALFGQGSSQSAGSNAAQSRAALMNFFSICDSLLGDGMGDISTWHTRATLLDIVNTENLFDIRDDIYTPILRQNGVIAVNALTSHRQFPPEVVNFIFTILTTLTRIDYDLVSSPLTRVLPILATIGSGPDPSPISSSDLEVQQNPRAASAYLDYLLDYHSKTRTLDELIVASCGAFQSLDKPENISSKAFYQEVSSSCLLHYQFLDKIKKTSKAFLTPGQVLPVVRELLKRLQDTLKAFEDGVANNGGKHKKRREEKSSSASSGTDSHSTAIALAAMSKVVCAVLPSLPIQSLLENARQELSLDVQAFYKDIVLEYINKALQHSNSKHGVEKWGWEVVTTTLLRLRYSLLTASFALHLDDEKEVIALLFSTLKNSDLSSEVHVELLRSLLYHADRSTVEPMPVLEEAMRLLERGPYSDSEGWSGKLAALSDGSDSVQVPVFHMLSDRWLHVFNQHASDEQCTRWVSIVVSSIVEDKSHGNSLTMTGVSMRTLKSAQFWECDKLRVALLSQVIQWTKYLDAIDVKDVLAKKKVKKVSSTAISQTQTAYLILLHMPIDGLSRNDRSILVRRAVTADLLLSLGFLANDAGQPITLYLREFLRRVFTADEPTERQLNTLHLDHLLESRHNPNVTPTTIELVSLYFGSILSQACRGDDASFVETLQSFQQSAALNLSEGQASTDNLRYVGLVALVKQLTTKHQASSLKETTLTSLSQFGNRLFSFLHPRLENLLSSPAERGPDIDVGTLLQLWLQILRLQRWLHTKGSSVDLFGPRLALKLLSAQASLEVCIAILSLLIEELHHAANHEHHLNVLLTVYLSIGRRFGGTEVADCMSKFVKKLSLPDFSYALDLIIDGLTSPGLRHLDLVHLIHLSSIMVHEAPEGSLKITQNHFSRCLSQFVNRPKMYLKDTTLQAAVLRSVSKHFNDRPAAIRGLDVANTWSLLGTCLAGSTTHDEKTTPTIYHEIVSIISALIRLRRDLVLSTLPHLGVILRQLIFSLKTLPPNMGGKQSRIVADSLPSWINVMDPLTAEESKAVARLLTTLTTKTIVRTHVSTTETQKAESLARPFSKHVSSVLTAYIDLLNDPLCVLPLATRRELAPGCLALCDMMGEQNRDAMMATLDSGGKTTMKALWKEYEKQRYVGKG
ncbi:hypothetical protein ABKN59_000993 [Abortiporus biennis]